MQWDLTLVRKSRNRLNPESTRRILKRIAAVASRNKTLGFQGKVGRIQEPVLTVDETTKEEVQKYAVKMRLVKHGTRSEEAALRQFKSIYNRIAAKANKQGWTIVTDEQQQPITDAKQAQEVVSQVIPPRETFVLPSLTEDSVRQFFNGVYERDAHIRIIQDCSKSYLANKGEKRSHVLLYGKPASCKTTLFERFKAFYEHNEKIERVVFVDGPTMSKAGLENWMLSLAESKNLPEVVVIEEIEKQNMDNLLTLLSVMGSGYIMKTNARIGRVREMAKCMIWATCNDDALLKQFRNGALWSRFTKRLHCKRPGQELMYKILCRECAERNLPVECADKAIQFAYELMPKAFKRELDDPREIVDLLSGGDRLLDDSYQKDLLTIMKTEHEELSDQKVA